jgi:hypothetical protein
MPGIHVAMWRSWEVIPCLINLFRGMVRFCDDGCMLAILVHAQNVSVIPVAYQTRVGIEHVLCDILARRQLWFEAVPFSDSSDYLINVLNDGRR